MDKPHLEVFWWGALPMSHFVTHTTDETPQILLVGEPSPLGEKTREFFQTKHMVVVWWSAAELKKKLSQGEVGGNTTSVFYKVVVLSGWQGGGGEHDGVGDGARGVSEGGRSSISPHLDEKTLIDVAALTLPAVVVARVATPIRSSDPACAVWVARTSADQKFLAFCQKLLPQASLFVGQDVWGKGEVFPLSLVWREGVLVDSAGGAGGVDGVGGMDGGASLHPITEEDFFAKMSGLLVHARRHKHLFRGTSYPTDKIIKHIRNLDDRVGLPKLIRATAREIPYDEQWHLHQVSSTEADVEKLLRQSAGGLAPTISIPPTPPTPITDLAPNLTRFSPEPSLLHESSPLHESLTLQALQPPPQNTRRLASLEKDVRSVTKTTFALPPLTKTTRSSVRVKPARSPVVENRFLRYEEHKKRIDQERKMHSRLQTIRSGGQLVIGQTAHQSINQLAGRMGNQSTHQTATQLGVVQASSSSPTHTSAAQDRLEKMFEKKLQTVFQTSRAQEKTQRVHTLATKVIRAEHKNTRRKRASYLIFLILGIVLGCGVWAGVFFWSKHQVLSSFLALSSWVKEGRYGKAPMSLDTVGQSNRFFSTQLKTLQPLLEVGSFDEDVQLSTLTASLSQTTGMLLHNDELTDRVWLLLTAQQNGDTAEVLNTLSSSAVQTYQQLSYLQADIAKNKDGVFSDALSKELASLTEKIQDVRKQISISNQLQPFFSWLAGIDGRRTYALFLVNNLELRGAGGVVQSLALITVERGVVSDVRTFDVSSLDRAAVGEMIAPGEFARFTGRATFRMEDAAWSPHVPATASQLNFFLEKSGQKKADGIIVMDTFALRDLIGLVGNVQVPEENEVLTKENFLDRLASHSEVKIVENDQKEYPTLVLSKALNRLVGINTPQAGVGPGVRVFNFIGEELRSAHLAVVVNNAEANQAFSALGWSGELTTPTCPAQLAASGCVVSTVMQVEENVGANHANVDIERKTDHNILVTKDGLRHERIMQFYNTSDSTAWPRGMYRSYLRVFVPPGAEFEKAEINGEVVAATDVVVGREFDKKYFGLLVEVPIQETRTVKILYREPAKLQTPLSLSFFNQKQMGIEESPLRVSIFYEAGLEPATVAPKPVLSEGKLVFTHSGDKHAIFGVTFR